MSLMAAGLGYRPLIGGESGELQQFGRGCPTGMMPSRAHRHLDGFQIDRARLAAAIEDDSGHLDYSARNFLPDRDRRFFLG